LKYLFCIQNYKQIYERKYTDLFDAFSSIGGIIQFCYYVFYIINYFYNDFILILNTQNLFLNDPKNKKIAKLIPLNKRLSYTIDTKKFNNNNNSILKHYESSNYLNELRNFKFVSKDQKSVLNDVDLSSLQLSESNDKESHFIFKKNKNENKQMQSRRSFQLNSKSILKFKLKDEQKKKNIVRYSMFNPKSSEIISPRNQNIDFHGRIFLSSNGDYLSNIKENINLENNNASYSKKVTFIDNRDKKYLNHCHHNSFAGNIKICNYLKKKRNTKITPVKNKKLKKTIFEFPHEKYYSQKLNFKEYICFICSTKKNKRRDILIIQQFRKKLLSEEHFFKSHLFIYLIIRKIKIDKEDKSDIKELYSEL
jgi:hypothetical protein